RDFGRRAGEGRGGRPPPHPLPRQANIGYTARMPRPRAPFRLRASRRTILLACILLLAGALVNVAVAGVRVGAPDSWTPGGPRRSLLWGGADGLSAAESREVGWRLAGSDLEHAWITRGLGYRV